MQYGREEHYSFLERELKAQVSVYNEQLRTTARYLLEHGEMFVAQYLGFRDEAMVLKFSSKHSLPRKGDHLSCLLLPKELRDYRNWGEDTYEALRERQGGYSEIVCIWHGRANNEGFILAGFHGVDSDFAGEIKEHRGIFLVLGPKEPPYEYIIHLQEVVSHNAQVYSPILDDEYTPHHWQSYLLDNKKDVTTFIREQLSLTNTIILQGPPGTGKSTMIAALCEMLITHGCTVLVTALTNRALMEVAKKPMLQDAVNNGVVLKTNLSYDEQHELPSLGKINEVAPISGHLILSTFYITSGRITTQPLFDYVIMDEASQALLAMFEVCKCLGKHNLWIGDVQQLPPVVATSDDKINRRGWRQLVEGLNTLTECSALPIYQLTTTFRLSPRAAEYTRLFYNGNYHANSTMEDYHLETSECAQILHAEGGPTLLTTDLPRGEAHPTAALVIATAVVAALYKANDHIQVAVLACMIKTVQHLQKTITSAVGRHDNLIIETVARVQGLTTDVTIFVIPNTVTYRSLETRLFNVATSRAKGFTIIIADKCILQQNMPTEVREYLEKLHKEYSFYLPYDEQHHKLFLPQG